MFPLAAKYAPENRKTTMTSIIVSGLVLGILVARLLSGIVTQYAPWRTVYWLSLALQVAVFVLLYLFMRDYPVARTGTSYAWLLRRIVALPFRAPALTQNALVAFLVMGMFTSFWTTLTFQLASPVFDLSTLEIGLFALAGIAPALLNPLVSRLLVSRIHTHGTLLIALPLTLAVVVTGTFLGTFSLAGPVIWALLGDLGLNTVIVANRAAIAAVDPSAHNAVNAVYMIFTFAGQLFGTAVGNALYARGGWTWSGALNIAQLGVAVALVLVRGPHEEGWVGWGGGWDLRRGEVVGEGRVGDSEGGSGEEKRNGEEREEGRGSGAVNR